MSGISSLCICIVESVYEITPKVSVSISGKLYAPLQTILIAGSHGTQRTHIEALKGASAGGQGQAGGLRALRRNRLSYDLDSGSG